MNRTALTVGIAWGIAALVVWAWIRAATRPIPALRYTEPEDGVQPWDTRTMTLVDPMWIDWRTGEWLEIHD